MEDSKEIELNTLEKPFILDLHDKEHEPHEEHVIFNSKDEQFKNP